MRIKEIKNLLKEAFPLKKFGQNFLLKESILKEIVKIAEIQSQDLVLEIGAGFGNLTKFLAEKAKKVLAVEKDKRLVEILKEELRIWNKEYGIKNVEVLAGDILKILDSDFKIQAPFKVVGNLPYYLSLILIRKFLERKEKPELMVFLIQKEVAQKICAKTPKANLLALSVQFYGKPKIISFVKKNFFWPKPKVDGAILKIKPFKNGNESLIDADLFFKVLKAGFSHPRKQLLNNLSDGLKLNKKEVKSWLLLNNIQPTQRAETLTIEDWLNLTKSFKIN